MIYNEYVDNFIKELQNIKSFNGKIKYADNNFQRIGSGSGRIVYDIDDKVAFKLAKNPKGIGQNEAEAGVGVYNDTQHIVAKIVDFDDNQYTWVLAEKAKKVTESRIKQLTGIPSLNELFYFLRNNEELSKGNSRLFRISDEITEELYENEFASELVDLISNYGQSAGDMGRPSTYGEVLRDGQPTIVLTDYGINDEVYNTYYSPQRKKQHQLYELYNFADGNDDILSDIGNVGEIRHGMWAQIPYSVSDGTGVVNEDFIHFVSNRDYYPSKPLEAMPYLVEHYHDCVNNLKEVLNTVPNKKKFYENLIKLENYLIEMGWYNREPLKEIQISEDGTALYSTDRNIGNDMFPTYNSVDTSPSIENDLDANSVLYTEDLDYNHVDDATQDKYVMSERKISAMDGSSSVEVKDKCKLGGLGNTSVACNQGDINNLKIKPLKETIDAGEAHNKNKAIAAMIRGDKDVSFFRIDDNDINVINKYGFNTIPINQKLKNVDMRIVYRNTSDGISKAKKLVDILNKNNGYLKDNSPEDAIKIGRLLDYSEASIREYVKKRYGNILPSLPEPSLDDYQDFDEGVGDKYLEKKHGFKPEFSDFEQQYNTHKNREGEKIVYSDDSITIIRNPKTLANIGAEVRGVIDKNGNLYVEEHTGNVHAAIIDILDKLNLLIDVNYWHKKLPTEFITVQRLGNSNAFFLGESNVLMRNPDDRFNADPYWRGLPTYEEAKPEFEKFLIKAKRKNPQYDFRNVLIYDYENGMDIDEGRKLDQGWFAGSQVVDDQGNPLVVYHGTNQNFTRFNLRNAAQPIIWFSSDRDKIARGDSGAAGRSRIISAYLSIKKMAGWDEYERYGLGELYEMGYDGAKLDDDYFVFSPRQIRIIDNGFSKNENNVIFAKNNSNNMNEAELMSLQDLPFKAEIEKLGGKIFSVGGAVRDEFLGKESKDLDILITGVPFETLEELLSKYGKVDAVGKSFGILKFKPEGSTEDIDIAIPRTERATGEGGHKGFEVSSDHELPIEKDLERRDFTINAIAKDINGNIVDPYGGQEDLKNKIIRVVNPEAFSDDPLRMLRAVQFSSRFGFTIEPNTMKMIQQNASRINEIPPERILTEFDKIITKGNPLIGVELLVSTGLFGQIFGNNIKPSQIGRRDFNNVKTMADFLYLMMYGVVENPPEFYLKRFSTEDAKRDKIYKELKALDLAFTNDVTNPVKARSIAHNMYVISPLSLYSKIIPPDLQEAGNELLSGQYPKTTTELAVNGNDLMNAGLKGKEIGDMQKSLLLKIYSGKVKNNKEDLLALISQSNNPTSLNEERTEKIEYGALMLSLKIPKWNVITSKIKDDDLYKVGNEFGVESYPHVTLLYGFKKDVIADDVFDLYKENFDLNDIKIKTTKISIFETPDFDVVKIDVESEILNKINEVMKKLPHILTHPVYHPHITIAYVKKGEGKKYIKDFDKDYEIIGDELVFSDVDENQVKLNLNKKELVKEAWEGDVLYSCVLLDEESHNKLIKVFSPMIPEGWEILAHHMTLNLGKIDSKYENDLGKKVELSVTDYGIDDLVMAVGVRGYPTNNTKPHVTLAVNRANGGKPFMSNKLTDWRKIQFSLTLTGEVTEIKKQPLQEAVRRKKKKKSSYKSTLDSLMKSKNISKDMKELISKYVTGGSTYHEGGRVHGLSKPNVLREKSNKVNGVSMGADKKGFYVYTHRARSKSKPTPDGITVKEIEFINSTG